MPTEISAVLALLDQARDLARRVGAESWTLPSRPFRDATMGQHFRHVIEHFESLVAGLPGGVVDYDARRRDESIERSPAVAGERCLRLHGELAGLGKVHGAELPLVVCVSCAAVGRDPGRASSFGRELQFLVSHTVHHFAIIAAICQGQGLEVPGTFGVAPSTLKHREAVASAACAASE